MKRRKTSRIARPAKGRKRVRATAVRAPVRSEARPAPPVAARALRDEPQAMVPCRRLEAIRSVKAHLACPYCFGTGREVAAGDAARFCDYDAAQDPIVFGFPEDRGHYRRM